MKEEISELIEKAEALRQNTEYKDALKLFRKAAFLSKRDDYFDGFIGATIAIGDIYRMVGDFDSAIENYEEALDACEALGDELAAADSMAGIGLSLRALGRWREAIRVVKKAKKVYETENDRKGIAFSVWAEAGAWRVAGNIRKAIENFMNSKNIFSSIKFRPGIAYALCGLGGTHRISGKYPESLKYYRQANKMFDSIGDKFGMAYSHCGIGNAYRMLCNYKNAMEHLDKAVNLYETMGDIVSYSYTLWSLASVYKVKEDFANVRLYLKKASKNFKKTKDPRGIIYCNMTLGETEFMEGKHSHAKRRFLSALSIAEKHNFRLEKCHCQMLLWGMRNQGSENRRRKSQQDIGKNVFRKPSCYKKIGVDLDFSTIPFDIP